MRLAALAFAFGLLAVGVLGARTVPPVQDSAIAGPGLPKKLSDFGFFAGAPDKPNRTLIPYDLRNPLFSDYARKQRFIHLPGGEGIIVAPDGRVQFPVGTALIKTFGYTDQSGMFDALETRVLLRRETGWLALPYIWNPERTDALLKVAGGRVPVQFTKPSGEHLSISYAVPNKNQCKQCHSRRNELTPIGPVWPDMIFLRPDDKERLYREGQFPRNGLFARVRWDDANARLNERAGAYLYANCAHCHNREGSASNSGLFYDEAAGPYIVSGYKKRPVAAGRGSGDHEFIILPGTPEKSILIHRMKSLDPGVAMPEVGRSTVHDEGVQLLSEWITELGQ